MILRYKGIPALVLSLVVSFAVLPGNAIAQDDTTPTTEGSGEGANGESGGESGVILEEPDC